MRHDFDDYWSATDCNKKGIMSYYDPEDDRGKIRLLEEKKWGDVWTDCNVYDFTNWWNAYGKHCSFVNSHESLLGITYPYFCKFS